MFVKEPHNNKDNSYTLQEHIPHQLLRLEAHSNYGARYR